MVTQITDQISISQTMLPKPADDWKVVDAKYQENDGDSVLISNEARLQYQAKQEEKAANAAKWYEALDLKAGTTQLDNGNSREVVIDGSSFTIREYDEGKLLKSMTGEISGDSVALETEIYDKRGNVTQTVASTITEVEDESGGTSAVVSRSMQWFDDGELTREMHESMQLTTHYKGFFESELADNPQEVLQGVDQLDAKYISGLTVDDHVTKYFGIIQEYSNGKLFRETTVEQNSKNENLTNRTDDRIAGLEPWTTRETSHDMKLSITTQEYDSKGDLLREAVLSEEHKDGPGSADGKMIQNFFVSWYDKGELVKKSHGSLTLEETENKKLRNRPGILDILDIEERDYATPEAKEAKELMGPGAVEHSLEGESAGAFLKRFMGAGKYDSAGDIEDGLTGDQPYNLVWTNEVYSEGDMVAKQQDKQSARKNPLPKDLQFRTGKGLTEDDRHSVLRSTEHVDESYENGRLEQRGELKFWEHMETNGHDPDRLKSTAHGETGKGLNKQELTKGFDTGVAESDREANKASAAMSKELSMTTQDIYEIFKLGKSTPLFEQSPIPV